MLRWAGKKAPRVISMENVKQMMQWGPLIAKRDKESGRVIKLVEVDGKIAKQVAAPGERVPVQQQYLVPDPRYIGRSWRRFIAELGRLGYHVETQISPAANHGAATTRERLYMIARNDQCPTIWRPAEYHKTPTKGQKRWKPVAEVIDWNRPCPSIFLTREQAKEFGVKRPLADATLTRIAIGIYRYVLGDCQPFIMELANWSGLGVNPALDPLRTITGYPKGGAFALCSPKVVQISPSTATSVAPMMIRQFGASIGHPITEPTGTITAGGGGKSLLVTPILAHLRNNMDCSSIFEPMPVITAGGQHHAIIEAALARLSPENTASALRVSAFLMQYHRQGAQRSGVDDPCKTMTTRERLALVTFIYQGEAYVIIDIGLRMLTPRELYLAQGFPEDYIIAFGHDGRRFTIEEQVRMVGNSVSPLPMAAIAEDNDPWKIPQWVAA